MTEKEELCDYLIDMMCERDGIKETIEFLIGSGVPKEKLIELNFDEKDITEVLINISLTKEKRKSDELEMED